MLDKGPQGVCRRQRSHRAHARQATADNDDNHVPASRCDRSGDPTISNVCTRSSVRVGRAKHQKDQPGLIHLASESSHCLLASESCLWQSLDRAAAILFYTHRRREGQSEGVARGWTAVQPTWIWAVRLVLAKSFQTRPIWLDHNDKTKRRRPRPSVQPSRS